MMNLQDTLLSPPLLKKSKMKKPVSEMFCDEYMSSKDAMEEIFSRKKQRQLLRFSAKEKQYSELKLTDNWAETARKLYSEN